MPLSCAQVMYLAEPPETSVSVQDRCSMSSSAQRTVQPCPKDSSTQGQSSSAQRTVQSSSARRTVQQCPKDISAQRTVQQCPKDKQVWSCPCVETKGLVPDCGRHDAFTRLGEGCSGPILRISGLHQVADHRLPPLQSPSQHVQCYQGQLTA